jgi:hypothetical protein
MLTIAFTLLAPDVGNTLGGCDSHNANLSSPLHCLLHLKQHTVNHVDSATCLQQPNAQGLDVDIALMISGTTSARPHHHGDSATMRLHRHDDSVAVSTLFCVLPHDILDYDFKVRFESLPDSTIRLDTRGILMRTRPIGSSCLAYLVPAKEEAHSKDADLE